MVISLEYVFVLLGNEFYKTKVATRAACGLSCHTISSVNQPWFWFF
jgi:hypothetical protein